MSSSVYFHLNLPLHVVVLLRRLVNVVSTLSISNQCLSNSGVQVESPLRKANVNANAKGLVLSDHGGCDGINEEGSVMGLAGVVPASGKGMQQHMRSGSGSGSSSSNLNVNYPPHHTSTHSTRSHSPHGQVKIVNVAPPPPDLNVNFKTLSGHRREREREKSTWMWLRTSHYWRWHLHWQWNRGLLVVPPSSAMSISTHAHVHEQTGVMLSNDATVSSAEPSLNSAPSSAPPPSHSPHTPPSKQNPTRWMVWTWKRLFISSSKSTAHDTEQEQQKSNSRSPRSDPLPSTSPVPRTTPPSSSSSSTPIQPNNIGPDHPHSSSSSSHEKHPDPDLHLHKHAANSASHSPPPPPPSSSPHHDHESHRPGKKATHNREREHNHQHSSNSTSNHNRNHTDADADAKAKAKETLPAPDVIHQLLAHPALFDPVRTPRYPIVLCHGLYGFDSRGPSAFPSMRMHYWSNVLNILRGRVGAEVIVTSVPGTGFISTRASALHDQLAVRARGRGINFLAHSMGGLDCRYLISRVRPSEYVPLSLTTIATPHRGSPFMDWCANNIGIGKLRQQEQERERAREMQREKEREERESEEMESEMMASLGKRTRKDIEDFTAEIEAEAEVRSSSQQQQKRTKANSSTSSPSSPFSPSFSSSPLSLSSLSSLPSSFTTLLLSIVDSPAYANLTSSYLTQSFNPRTPDDPRVKYWSVAGRMDKDAVGVWHPFWLPKMVLDGMEEREREGERRRWVEEMGRRGIGIGMREEDGAYPHSHPPLWADERQWGNDGLVTVQSAQWGEFLGIMEGCDHWEMRGARGIELGVDLPAIPSIGLGSFPLASSLGNRSYPPSASASGPQQARQADGDGWGFGDWSRFVSAWKRTSNSTSTSSSRIGGEGGDEVKGKEEEKEKEVIGSSSTLSSLVEREAGSDVSSHPSTSMSATESISTSVDTSSTSTSEGVTPTTPDHSTDPASSSEQLSKTKTEEKAESKAQKRERERLADDQVVKTSTDTLSVVFDWLIERVPVSTQILGGGGAGANAGHDIPSQPKENGSTEMSDKELGDVAVRHMVGGSASVSASSSGTSDSASHSHSHSRSQSHSHSHSPKSDMKKRMDKEDKGRNKKRELAKKEDLERFYVALARKMYDEGL